MAQTGLLKGRKVLVVGLANKHSIAAGITEALKEAGAEIALTYQNEKLESRVRDLAAEWGIDCIMPCDVGDDAQIEALLPALEERWGSLDGLVHSVAYAPADQLEGNFVDKVTREGFRIAHDVSSYSLTALARVLKPLMSHRNAGIVTLTYLGAEKVVSNYNTMGLAKASLEANVRYMAAALGELKIRVNAVSAGPIRTLAASTIKDFKRMLDYHERVAPLKENVTLEQVGRAVAFLCSEWAGGITGEVLHVDSGFHAMAVPAL